MNTSEVRFVPDDWNRYAKCYDFLRHLGPYTAMLTEVVEEVISNGHTSVLDASCGTGNFENTLYARGSGQDLHVTAIDSSKEMMARAKVKCASYSGVSFVEANLNQQLPLPGNSFGQVVSINTLYAVQNPTQTLLEFHRVLKQGGNITVVTPITGYENGMILKAHSKSPLPDSYWENMHQTPEREEKLIREAIQDESVISDMLTVGKYNRDIALNATFHFFHKQGIQKLFLDTGFIVKNIRMTYAEQALLVSATKP